MRDRAAQKPGASSALLEFVKRLSPYYSARDAPRGTPDPSMAVSVAHYWHCSKSNSIASLPMSLCFYAYEEGRRRIHQSVTRRRQEGDGGSAQGGIRSA